MVRDGVLRQGWQRWAETVYHPPQPWKRLLGSAIRSAASDLRPRPRRRRRHLRAAVRRCASLPGAILPGAILPSAILPGAILHRRPPRFSVVIDTSGSVSDTELGGAPSPRSPRSLAPCPAAATWSACCPVTPDGVDDPDYVPHAPPAWDRVVTIG